MLDILPSNLKEKYVKNMLCSGIKDPERTFTLIMGFSAVLSLLISLLAFFRFNLVWELLAPVFLLSFVIINFFFYFRYSLKASAKIKRMEDLFPDFIQLMASNLRAGMTIDKAFILSAREEFYPLSEEIMRTGKEITTGKEVIMSLSSLSKRIASEKIDRTIKLIISGIKSGGNLSILLEQTSSNMREKEFVEKRATSSISMYVIFIFVAACLGAPLLFGLSSILVEAIIKITSSLPQLPENSTMPITFGAVNLSINYVIGFSILFILCSNLLSSLVIGLINKGDQKEGLKYFIPMALGGIIVFFLIRKLLVGFLLNSLSFS